VGIGGDTCVCILISTFCGCPHRCDSVAVDFGQTCAPARRTEGRRCTAAEEASRPGSGGAPSRGHRHIVGVRGICRGSAAAQAEGLGPGWRAELSSGPSGMFGGSRFLPRGGSSARTGYMLDRHE